MTTTPKTTLAGGKRQGSGRKTIVAEAQAADDYGRLVKAKADTQERVAALADLKYKKMAGELAMMAEVMQLYTMTIAVFAEQMRSLPDALERKAGLTPAQAEVAADFIDDQLEQLRERLTRRLEEPDATRQ